MNASATLNSSKASEVAELEATGSRGQLHPPTLHSQVANLRIADSQNLANANDSNPPAALAGCGQGRAAAKRNKWRGPV